MQIHILAFLLFFQSFVACQQGPETDRLPAYNVAFQSADTNRQNPEQAPSPATGIVYKSVDGGQTWQDVSEGLPRDAQIRCVLAGNNEVLLGSESGVYRSTNPPAARAWEKEFFPGESITGISPGWAGPYVCIYGSGIFQVVPGRGIWKSVGDALKDKTVLTVLETADATLFAGSDNGIFKSADGGKTWKQVFAEGMVSSLVAADGVLIGGGFRGVLRSTDGGEHWDWVLTEDGMALKTGRIGGRFFAITSGLGPWEAKNTNPLGLAANMLRTSADGGKTWQRIDGSLAPALFSSALKEMDGRQPVPPRAINDIEEVGEDLFCSLGAGIFRSVDHGKTWKLLLPSDGNKSFELVVSGNVLFAVAIFGGC